jgi:hypothetical protein
VRPRFRTAAGADFLQICELRTRQKRPGGVSFGRCPELKLPLHVKDRVDVPADIRRPRRNRVLVGGLIGACLIVTACNEPRPRTYTEFMEDAFAREGTLVRCNTDRDATTNDLECANARRAAATVALLEERARREALEAESERLRTELRDRIAQQQEAERRADALRQAVLQAAYDAQWVDPDNPAAAVALEVPPGLFRGPVLNPADALFGAPRAPEQAGEPAAATPAR